MKLLLSQLLSLTIVVICVAQSSQEAVKVDSFEMAGIEFVDAVLDSFIADISRREKGTRGVVVNYGTPREVALRKRLISSLVRRRNFDASLVEFVLGGNVSKLRTELWIVPPGAASPQITPEAYIVAEYGRVTKSTATTALDKFFNEMNRRPDHRVYFVIYGSEAELSMHENWIRRHRILRHAPNGKVRLITIIHRGEREKGVGTVMWLAPPGASSPSQ